jgi:hypothetical protein
MIEIHALCAPRSRWCLHPKGMVLMNKTCTARPRQRLLPGPCCQWHCWPVLQQPAAENGHSISIYTPSEEVVILETLQNICVHETHVPGVRLSMMMDRDSHFLALPTFSRPCSFATRNPARLPQIGISHDHVFLVEDTASLGAGAFTCRTISCA